MGYCTVDDIKSAMIDAQFTPAQEVLLQTLIDGASDFIDAYTGRARGSYAVNTQTIKYYNGSGDAVQWINEIADAPVAVEYLDTSSKVWVPFDVSKIYAYPYNQYPANALLLDSQSDLTVFPYGRRNVRVTGYFGYSRIPPNIIKQATIMVVVRWFKRGQQAYQDTGAIIDLGQLKYTQAIDPEVHALLTATGLRRIVL